MMCLSALNISDIATTFIGVLIGVPAGMFLFHWQERIGEKQRSKEVISQSKNLVATIRDAITFNKSRLSSINTSTEQIGKRKEIMDDVDPRFLAESSRKRYELIDSIRLNYFIDSLVRQLEEFQIFLRYYRTQYYLFERKLPDWDWIGPPMIRNIQENSKSIINQIGDEILPELNEYLDSLEE